MCLRETTGSPSPATEPLGVFVPVAQFTVSVQRRHSRRGHAGRAGRPDARVGTGAGCHGTARNITRRRTRLPRRADSRGHRLGVVSRARPARGARRVAGRHAARRPAGVGAPGGGPGQRLRGVLQLMGRPDGERRRYHLGVDLRLRLHARRDRQRCRSRDRLSLGCCQGRKVRPDARISILCCATIRFSSAVMPGNRLMFWKVRATRACCDTR